MILVRNGTVIDPGSGQEGALDLLIDDGKILDIGKRGSFDNAETREEIDAEECLVVPGLIDLHVHLREPGEEWKETIESGARAAVRGGYTTVCAMPNTMPRNDHQEVTRFVLRKAAEAGLARVLPIGAVSLGLKGEAMSPLSELRTAGCIAFSDDGEPIHNAGLMRRALEWCKMLGATIACHEEDKCLSRHGAMNESSLSARLGLPGWPKVAEEVMIARDIELARATGGRVHFCHVTTARGVELIRRAKNDGIPVSAEVTPHHLLLTEDAVSEYDTNAKMSPPLREEEDVDGVRAGLKDGTIDAVASDHAPHHIDSKRLEFPEAAMGILGLQTSLPILLGLVRDGALSRRRAVEAMTHGPARVFGLEYGTLKRGAPADVTIVDPEKKWRFSREAVGSISFNSPFINQLFQGGVVEVLVNGRRINESGGVQQAA